MRKRLYFILLLNFAISYLLASDMYFAPYAASSNINLNTPAWSEPADNPKGVHDWFPENRIVALASTYQFEWQYYYYNIWPIKIDEIWNSTARDYGMRITVSSSSYHDGAFWFVSQSNPDSQRPFNLQFAGQVRTTTDGDLSYNDYGYVGSDGWKSNGSTSVYRDLIIPEDELKRVSDGAPPIETSLVSIMCDVGIVLPGEITNGVLDYNNNTYIIAPASDYSAEVTIRIELITKEGAIVTESNKPSSYTGPLFIEYTIPFSGFYDPLQEGYSLGWGVTEPLEIGSSLAIETLPGAANFDLGNQSQYDVPIANLNYAIYNLAVPSDVNSIDEQVFIFLSSSPSPYISGSKFRFVHEDVGLNEEPTPENSINYTIKAISTEDSSMQPVVFDGTDYLKDDGKEFPGNNRLTTEHHEEVLTHARYPNRHWHTFIGQLQLSLVPNPRLIVPGYYDSYVYVHVIVDDSLEVMQ